MGDVVVLKKDSNTNAPKQAKQPPGKSWKHRHPVAAGFIEFGTFIGGSTALLTGVFGAMNALGAFPKDTKCQKSMRAIRDAIVDVKKFDERASHKLNGMTELKSVPGENGTSSREVKEIMEKRAELNQAVREKWEAWKSCSDGINE